MTMFEKFQAMRQEAGRVEEANWEAVKKGGCKACHYNIEAGNCPYPCGQQVCWYDLEYHEGVK